MLLLLLLQLRMFQEFLGLKELVFRVILLQYSIFSYWLLRWEHYLMASGTSAKAGASAPAESEVFGMAITDSNQIIEKFMGANEQSLKEYFSSFLETRHRRPCLVVMTVGDDQRAKEAASRKVLLGGRVGVDVVVRSFPETVKMHDFRSDLRQMAKDLPWTFTEKCDGTSMRAYWDGHTVTFGGRTDRAQDRKSVV